MRPLADVQDEHVDVQGVPASSDLVSPASSTVTFPLWLCCRMHRGLCLVLLLSPWSFTLHSEPLTGDTSEHFQHGGF